jgi:choloylglycine hydrolase
MRAEFPKEKTAMTLPKKCLLSTSLALALLSTELPVAQACTRALWNTAQGQMMSARNLDFFGPVRPSLVVSPRGVQRVGASGEDAKNSPHWRARYGSVVIYADDRFPMDGMNEKGLVGHTLFYTGGAEAAVPGQPAKPVLESRHWLSYLLDNNATVAEALKAIEGVRLVPKKLPIDYASDTKHIAIEDATGDSAIIEITQGKVNVFHGRQYTVLTNPPDYGTMIKKMEETANASPLTIPGGWDATSRLTRPTGRSSTCPSPTTPKRRAASWPP